MYRKAQEIAKGIYAVGAADRNATHFHGYYVHNGVTYNAYLIDCGNTFALVDTVHRDRADELLARIASVTDPKNVSAVIVNHTEPDHSGALPAVLEKTGAKAYGTVAAAKLLAGMYGISGVTTVKNGETLHLGNRSFTFVATPMVHWPDNMVTYLAAEQILFSNDAFGQHYATENALDTQNDADTALAEAQHYFANIVMPYRAQTAKAIDAALALPLRMIAPSHGVIWTERIPDIANLYRALTIGETSAAVLAFDSMWGGTADRAQEAFDELHKKYGVIHTFDLRDCHMSDVISALSVSEHVCIGSPTYNGYPTPRVSTLIAEIEALKPPVKSYSLFGTFAWGGGASKKITEKLDALGYEKTFDLTRIC
ncbi:MAG: FprA family A-type flavoprotein [Clostridiales bacterium]|nr:FprA family A-type flavoprotein [Clostridiales bacterium]